MINFFINSDYCFSNEFYNKEKLKKCEDINQ